MIVLAVVGLIGLVAAVMMPAALRTATAQDVQQQDRPGGAPKA
jgi:type II secretory pathway pseudopilin PulG